MKKKSKNLSNEHIVLLAGIILSVLFLLLDMLGSLTFLRRGISYIMDPIDYNANLLGTQSREYIETFAYLQDFRDEFNQMNIDIYEQEVKTSFFAILQEENDALRKQISLRDQEQKYVMAKVLSNSEVDILRINRGERDGVAVGDIVHLGNMLVGIVVNVDGRGSSVRTPLNRGSSLEVIVVSGHIEEIRSNESTNILSKGVVRGSSEGIVIENMSMSANLENGNVVVVNDSRVGEYLVLGYLQDISENPAATSRSGFVSPIVDYEKLITVFVKIDI